MRAEVELAPAPPVASAPVRRSHRERLLGARWRLDWFELSVLVLFGAVSLWVAGLDLWQVVEHGRTWTGTDGVYLVDQMQYLAWITSASHHLLVTNMYVLRHTPADYFMPAVLISGGLTALGMAPWLALLLWKPVAVVVTFFAIRAYAHRSLAGTWERRVAIAFGVFFGSATLIYGSLGTIGDLFPPFLSWGYSFALLALGTMVLAILAYDRARAQTTWSRAATAALVLGALSSLLHPWQGELLVLILIGAELAAWWRDRRRPALRLPVLAVLSTGLPLFYYLILGHVDLSWRLARMASKHAFSISTILLAVVPLLIPAAVAYRGWPKSFLGVVTRVWLPATLVIYVVSASNVSATPLHAFQGITIPLAILAIEGLRRLRFQQLPGHRAIAALVVAAATIPGAIYQMHNAAELAAPTPGTANFITADEHHALDYLARVPVNGGVLTRFYLGVVVPGTTGRQSFIGDCLWSEPDCIPRAQLAQMVFDGTLPPASARWFVQRTGARFLLADCHARADLDRVLAPLLQSARHFGCAAVYTLKATSAPRGPLAESPPHAPLRAQGRQQRRLQHS